MKILRATVAAAVCSAAISFAVPAAADHKVAVVDVQRAVMQTEDGLRAQAMLKKLFDSRQQELNRKQGELAKQKDEIEKQAKSMSRDAYEKKAQDWARQMQELQGVFMEYNKELEKKQKEITEPIFEKVMAIVKQLAAREGCDVVLDKAAVAYVRSELDFTDKAIQAYNSGK